MQDFALLVAVLRHGYVNSAAIQADESLNLVAHMSSETAHAGMLGFS